MKRYKFDLRSGHYINVLNEEFDLEQNDSNNQQQLLLQNQSLALQTANGMDSLTDNVISDLKDRMIKKDKEFSDFRNRTLNSINILQNDINNANSPEETKMKIQQQLKLLNDLINKEEQYNNEMTRFKRQITLQQMKLVSERYDFRIPKKYSFLTESNINTAKIYMNNMVDPNDDNAILKGMADFKRAFRDTELLYGKDKEGYYVVCVDLEDFDRMYDALQETGYMRDVIIDNIMPLLFDRKDMIS